MSPTGRRGGGIDVDIQGLREALREVGEKGRRAANLKPAFQLFRHSVRQFADLQFRTAGSFGQVPWKDLAPETVRRRRRTGANRGGAVRPLWDTGNFRSNLLNRPLVEIDRDRFSYGTHTPYARHVAGPDTDRPMFPDVESPFLEQSLEEAVEAHLAL